MGQFILRARTFLALGLRNIWRVAWYRFRVKIGFYPLRSAQVQLPQGPYYLNPSNVSHLKPSKAWSDHGLYFGWYRVGFQTYTPDWHYNPFLKTSVSSPYRSCWEIADFDQAVGDIKTVWEASRFDWVLAMAQRASAGRKSDIDLLNTWLADWCQKNPAYYGPNWKCGQEAAIRVIHLAVAAFILGQHEQPQKTLLEVVKIHLQRIASTLDYALAQDNNHGTSEAAALYIGGCLLQTNGDKTGEWYRNLGEKWLEDRARRLISSDGSFSQYSVNYHRLMLDTYSVVEFWRKLTGLPLFSDTLYDRLKAATNWLYQLTQFNTGDAPNLGANDGARILPLSETDYRDYRPSVQLATAIFCNARAYDAGGSWNLPLQWLSIKCPKKKLAPPTSTLFEDGGYCTLLAGESFLCFNMPKFRFRPSQSDSFHLDLWVNGENILRDAGTYCYNAGDEVNKYFGGTESHNTVQFDDRDQMPRLGRFLFGGWLKCRNVIYEKGKLSQRVGAEYRDYYGAVHCRDIALEKNKLVVVDKVSGFSSKAVLRWRLQPGDWQVHNNTLVNGRYKIQVKSSETINRFEVVEGLESRYYLQKSSLPVLEVEISKPGEFTTECIF